MGNQNQSQFKAFRIYVLIIKYLTPSGINSNFTTVLIKYYNDVVNPNEAENPLSDAVIGVIQEIPLIIFALVGGFLQQKFGPKKLLISSAVPSILSWVVVAVWSHSYQGIIVSRLLAGLAAGLLSGNRSMFTQYEYL